VSGPDFMVCAPGLDFGGTEGACSHFHVLRCQNRLGWYRGRQVLFSCFALLDSISSEPSAPGPVFMFCAPGLVFGGTEGVGSRFHVLRSQTHYGRYSGRRFAFSSFAIPDSFGAVPRVSDPVLKVYAPKLVFDGTEGVGSSFHVLRS
jgi:hypothetical protein